MHGSKLLVAAFIIVTCASACATGAGSPLPSTSPTVEPPPSRSVPPPLASAAPGSQAPLDPIACVGGDSMLTADARGPRGDLAGIARAAVSGVATGDQFEVTVDDAGSTVVRITRNGQEIGTLWYSQDPDGGWLLSQWSTCAGLSVT